MEFKLADDKLYSLIDEYIACTDYVGSDFTHYGFLVWFERIEYAEDDRALYLRGFDGDIVYYWRPLVKDGMTVAEALKKLPRDATLYFCTKDFADEFSDLYRISSNRNWAEYIYRTQDFISLKGKRYNAKRNHCNKFASLYNFTLKPYTALDRSEVIEFEDKWLAAHCFRDEQYLNSALAEREILLAALDASLKGETVCDVLRVDGTMVGISIGERLSNGNAVIIYEKADITYDGAYSFLAHEFAAENFADCPYINRQEDMGAEGLRKSKLSYCPEYLLEKYVLTPKWLMDSADGKQFTCRKLTKEDFNIVMRFLKDEISSLDDKKFFLNYTDDELMNVLENGYMLGAYDGELLIGTCAVDLDEEYGKQLADICGYEGDRKFYEFSGIMVREGYRKKGVASALCKRVISESCISVGKASLCAVVQYDNIPSLNNLKKLGFEEKAEAKYKEFDFKYLALNVN